MPFINQLHVNKLLTQISVKYKNPEYLAQEVFPIVPVKTDSDLYRVFARNFRVPETKRANKGEARQHLFDVSTASYQLAHHALKDFVSDRDKDNYDAASIDVDTTEELTDAIMRRMELDFCNVFTTTNWSLNVSLAAANAFTANTTVSNPIPVFHTGAATVVANSGYAPNIGIVNLQTKIAMSNHLSVLDRVKYTSAEITDVMLAKLFDLEKLFVSKASNDTAAKGLASTVAAMWGDVAWLGYKPARATPLAPSSGYVFKKDKQLVKKWRVEERESDCIEVNMAYDIKVVASLSGYLIKDVI